MKGVIFLNILVTIDKNYLYPLTVLLKSIRVSNPNSYFDIYVAHSSLDESDFDRLRQCVDKTRMKIHSVPIRDSLFEGAPSIKRLNAAKASYYRLLAIDFMPEGTDRVLYLDPDIVVINPLDRLYYMNMEDNLIAAAGHTTVIVEFLNRKRLKLKKGSRYINAGIILMNIEKMREEYTLHDIFQFIDNKKDKPFYLIQGDQDVMNGMFTGRIKIIDERVFNLDEKTFKRFSKDIDLGWVRKNTMIIHYNGDNKPWKEDYKGVLQGFFEKAKNADCVPFPATRVS